MIKIFGNTVVFVVVYLLFMLPTYVLPFFGSNSVLLNAAVGLTLPFWLHLLSLIALTAITFFRGVAVDKKWLIIFPILATVFDLIPVLVWIPLVPTVMHLFAIILGVTGAKTTGSA